MMQVIFRRTGQRRYAIEARRGEYPDVGMDPAPGYDALMPHDLLHMVVEAELGLTRGVFGQLAAGGDAGTFGWDLEPASGRRTDTRRRRRTAARGAKLVRAGQAEAAQSERASYILWYEWLARSGVPARQQLAKTMAAQAQQVLNTCPLAEAAAITEPLIERVSRHLERISALWSLLDVGEAIAISWPDLRAARVR